MAEANVREIPVGAEVRTEDGSSLGSVSQVLGDYFEVAKADERSIWLECSTVASVSDQVAHLDFVEDDLPGRIMLHEPDDPGESEYLSGDLSNEEEHQRGVMLEELAEQRAEMREEGRATDEADETVGEPVEEELEERK